MPYSPDPPDGPIDQDGASSSPRDPKFWASVNDELRRLADRMLNGERRGHTLQATALVDEAYMKLVVQANLSAVSRAAFMAAAAKTMRRLLIDHARARIADKRGGPAGASGRVTLSGVEIAADTNEVDPLDIDRALDELKALDARGADIVEMKFFGGMNHDDIAQHLGISARSVDGEWAHAKGWLRSKLAAYAVVAS